MRLIFLGNSHFSKHMIGLLGSDFSCRYFDPGHSSFSEKLRFLLALTRADGVVQVGGTLSPGGALRMAHLLRKKIHQHLIGSDLLALAQQLQNSPEPEAPRTTWTANAPWLTTEAQNLGINAPWMVDAIAAPAGQLKAISQFRVLSYCPPLKESLYRFHWVEELARAFPGIEFRVLGYSKNTNQELPENLKCLGWIDTVAEEIQNSAVFLRLTEHDGISHLVIDSLAQARWVIRTNPQPGVEFVTSLDECKEALKALKDKFDQGQLGLNLSGQKYVMEYFQRDRVQSLWKELLLKTFKS